MRRIFDEYVAGAGLYAIAEGLNRDRVPCPSQHDPARNRHRSGRAWSKGAVRAIIENARYTGRQVWNRQRRDEVLVDVDDVAAGHETRMRWNDRADWIVSAEQTHEAIISPELFARAQEHRAAGRGRPSTRKARGTPRPYVLRGILDCGICGRRMAGTSLRDEIRYRCRYPVEYALVNEFEHPKAVYVREDRIVPALDTWLRRFFHPSHLDETLDLLDASSAARDIADAAGIEAARRQLADCDERLARYRTSLENGMDSAIIKVWTDQVLAERLAAERAIANATPAPAPSRAEFRKKLAALKITSALANAKPADRAALYADLNVRLVYRPADDVVDVEAGLCAAARVGGGTRGLTPRPRLVRAVSLAA